MLKKNFTQSGCIIKQPALTTRSTRAEESQNAQSTLANNIEKSYQKKFQ